MNQTRHSSTPDTKRSNRRSYPFPTNIWATNDSLANTNDSSASIQEITARGDYVALHKDQWSHSIEYFLSCLGYAVGLSNLWRFPYLTMIHGGGAFLVPYFLFLFIAAMPIFLAETTIGQYTGLTPVKIFQFVPLFQGVGWSMVLVSGVLCIYFNLLMTWIIFYLIASFQWELPWGSCFNEWNTDKCRQMIAVNESVKIEGWTYDPNSTVSRIPVYRGTMIYANWNESFSSTEEYWYNNVLRLTDDPSKLGNINWRLFGCLVIAWIVTALCLIKGVKSIGKVVYVTVFAPYIFLTIILIRGLTLPGYEIGLKYFFTADWEKLLGTKIWGAAATQIFYSLGPCWGGLITMASFNRLNHNCYRDSIIIPILTCASSFYCGLVIYSVLGHMAYLVGSENFSKIARAGPGLVFIAYPEALNLLPGGCIWSVLFFFMLLSLGLDSLFTTLETMTASFAELFPKTLGRYKKTFVVTVCLTECILGIPFVYEGGFYLFTILDVYTTPCAILFIGFFETIAFALFYDGRRAWKQLIEMTNNYLKWLKPWWYATWYALAPISLIVVISTSILTYERPKDKGGAPYPDWAVTAGLSIGILGIASIPIFSVLNCWKFRKSPKQVLKPTVEFKTFIDLRHGVPSFLGPDDQSLEPLNVKNSEIEETLKI